MFRRRHRHETTESDDRCQLGSSRLRCSAAFLQRFEDTTLGHPGSVARTFRAADEKVSACGRGLHSTEVAYVLASHPAAPGSILGLSKNFSLDVAEIH